jgi:hypothetical protein
MLVHHGREGMSEQRSSCHRGQEAEKGDIGKGQGKIYSQGHALNDLLTPARPYLLKFPQYPKIVPPVGDKASKT